MKKIPSTIKVLDSKNQKISLEKKFKEYNGKNLSTEFIWDESIGRERYLYREVIDTHLK